jgi:type II secretory pathway pseudopilin PulG
MKKMLVTNRFKKVAGLTLLETMFALAVGALVLIGAVLFYMSTKQSGNTSRAVGDMNAIVSAIGNYTGQNYDINNLVGTGAVGILQSKGYLPDPLLDPWGQPYGVTVSTTGAKTQVSITIPGIGAAGKSVLGKPISGGDKNCNAIVIAVGSAATSGGLLAGGCAFTYTL